MKKAFVLSLYELDWDNESTVESVLLMRRAKR